MADGYQWNETPESRRYNRMYEISQGAKQNSLGGLLERLTGPGGLLGGSGGQDERPPRLMDSERLYSAGSAMMRAGVPANPGQEPFVGEKEGPRQAPPGTPGYGRGGEEYPYRQQGMNETGLFRREEDQQLENFRNWAARIPEDVKRAVDEYVDANPSVTKSLQQAADNGDYRRFYQEYTDLVDALGLGGR